MTIVLRAPILSVTSRTQGRRARPFPPGDMVAGGSMKARGLLLPAWVAAAIASWSSPAWALDPVGDDIFAANNQVGASFVARHIGYDELNNGLAPGLPDVLDSETGWAFGFLAEAKIQRDIFQIPNVYLRPSFGLTWGTLTYDGRTQPTGPGGAGSVPLTAESGATILDLGIDVGVGIPLGTSAALTPIVRIGQRRWRREVGQDRANSYREDYAHIELGAGLLVQFVLARGVVLALSGTVGRTFAPSLAVTLPGVTSFDIDLGNGLVARGGASIDWALGKGSPLHAFLAYDLLWFNYGQSDPLFVGGGTLTEPASRTLQHEVRAGLAYAF
jgi:hypothetical protein